MIDWHRRPVLVLNSGLLQCSVSAALLRAVGLVPISDESAEPASGAGAGESKDAGDEDGVDSKPPGGAVWLRFLPGESETWTSLPPSVRSVLQRMLDRVQTEARVGEISGVPDCASVGCGVMAAVQGAARAARAQLRSSAIASLRSDKPDDSAWYQWKRALSLASKVLGKVIEDPDEPKWRRVNADSRAFVDAMGRLPSFAGDRISGTGLLLSCGWQRSSDGKLVLPSSATLNAVREQYVQLQCALELASLHTDDTDAAEGSGRTESRAHQDDTQARAMAQRRDMEARAPADR